MTQPRMRGGRSATVLAVLLVTMLPTPPAGAQTAPGQAPPAPIATVRTPTVQTPTNQAPTVQAPTVGPPALRAPAPVDRPGPPLPATSAGPPEQPALDRPVGRISVLGMVRGSDPVVQAVMALLLLCSAASWAVLVEKTIILGQVRRQTRSFALAVRDATGMDDVEPRLTPAAAGPPRQLWTAARREWELSLARIPRPFAPDQMTRLLQRLTLAMGIAQEGALSRLGNWMGLLATIGATAPFVGLFGTVWGILHSFAQIAATRSTSLAVVAPGIAEALLTTAVGLFAAIPATVFYNRFARSVGQITGGLDNVAANLLTLASRDFETLSR